MIAGRQGPASEALNAPSADTPVANFGGGRESEMPGGRSPQAASNLSTRGAAESAAAGPPAPTWSRNSQPVWQSRAWLGLPHPQHGTRPGSARQSPAGEVLMGSFRREPSGRLIAESSVIATALMDSERCERGGGRFVRLEGGAADQARGGNPAGSDCTPEHCVAVSDSICRG